MAPHEWRAGTRSAILNKSAPKLVGIKVRQQLANRLFRLPEPLNYALLVTCWCRLLARFNKQTCFLFESYSDSSPLQAPVQKLQPKPRDHRPVQACFPCWPCGRVEGWLKVSAGRPASDRALPRVWTAYCSPPRGINVTHAPSCTQLTQKPRCSTKPRGPCSRRTDCCQSLTTPKPGAQDVES